MTARSLGARTPETVGQAGPRPGTRGSSPTRVRLGHVTASAWWGTAFGILLLLGAGMFSAPTAADPLASVRVTYANNGTVIVVSQVVELLAAVAFARFSRALAYGSAGPNAVRLLTTGAAVAFAAVLTAVPPLWLTAVAESADASGVTTLLRAGDLSDVLLFAAIAGFAAAIAIAAGGRLRLLAVGVAVLSAARAVLLLAGSEWLGVSAPVAFLLLVAVQVVQSTRDHGLSGVEVRHGGRA